jgi:hypothetical protein
MKRILLIISLFLSISCLGQRIHSQHRGVRHFVNYNLGTTYVYLLWQSHSTRR